MVKPADLVSRADLQLGPLVISPSRRLVEGPAGSVQPEPLTMQALLLLLDAGGRVVTRTELFDQCWGGAMVGDDSLNRAIGNVRRVGAATAPGLFAIETIPRTGYRLTGPVLDHLAGAGNGAASAAPGKQPAVSRRTLVIGASAAAAVLGGGVVLWPRLTQRARPAADPLVDKAHDLLRHGLPGGPERARELLGRAVRSDPGSARAWGLLAYSLASELDSEGAAPSIDHVAAAEEALRKALRLDPREPNALLARLVTEGALNDWIPADQRLRSVLALDPANTFAMARLATLLQSAGLTRESFGWNQRHAAMNPLSPEPHYKRALQLWILGDTPRADFAVNLALERWPDHRWVWNARLVIYAFSGRAKAALAMLDDADTRPRTISADVLDIWRLSFRALAEPTAEAVARATAVNLDAARKAPGLAAYAVMTLAALGQVDAAFEIANGFLVGQGEISTRLSGAQGQFVGTRGWRRTHWLFTPPMAALHKDRRFLTLCNAIGLDRYWEHRRVRPDFLSPRA